MKINYRIGEKNDRLVHIHILFFSFGQKRFRCSLLLIKPVTIIKSIIVNTIETTLRDKNHDKRIPFNKLLNKFLLMWRRGLVKYYRDIGN